MFAGRSWSSHERARRLRARARVARVRNVPSILAIVLAGALVLGACGSTAQSERTATINAALRRFQAEVEKERSMLIAERRHGGSEGASESSVAIYAATPKGVTRAEWEAAVSKDKALQLALAALNHHGPPYEQPSTAEVEQSRREDVEIERHRSHPMIKRRYGALGSLTCHEATRGVWFCTLRFDEGRVVVERVAWYQNATSEGISLVSER